MVFRKPIIEFESLDTIVTTVVGSKPMGEQICNDPYGNLVNPCPSGCAANQANSSSCPDGKDDDWIGI